MLDNERYARKLRGAIRNAKSIHHMKRYVTRSDYVKLWQRSLEFDNYSITEIAKALTLLASGKARFSRAEVEACKIATESGAELKRLYLGKTGRKLNKMKLTEELVRIMFVPSTRAM